MLTLSSSEDDFVGKCQKEILPQNDDAIPRNWPPREAVRPWFMLLTLTFYVSFSDPNVNFSENLQGESYIMIEAKVLSRSFTYNGVKLPDPDPRMTPDEVKTIYSHQYPELATAAITGPEASGEQLQYSFVRAIGTKG